MDELFNTELDLTEYNALGEDADQLIESRRQEEAEAAKGTPEDQDQGFLPDNPKQLVEESGKALWGGAVDAVESIGGFGRRLYDTTRWGVYKTHGVKMDDKENIFHKDYEVKNPLEVPDEWEPENNSGLGRLTRGITEFVALTYATRGVGGGLGLTGKIAKNTKFWQNMNHAANNPSFVKAATAYRSGRLPWKLRVAKTKIGTRVMQFIPKGTKIASEGAIADFISESSEYANMANLVNEYAPWMPFSQALSVDPDDNPWMARIKTVMAGSGFNLGGYFIFGFARGRVAAIKARAAGKSIPESNIIGTNTMKQTIEEGIEKADEASSSMKDYEIEQGEGISIDRKKEWLKRHLNKEEWEELESLRAGNLSSTRGNAIYYHGAPFKEGKQPQGYKTKTQKQSLVLPGSQDLNIDKTFQSGGQRIWSDENLFGEGFYVSDDISVASKERIRTTADGKQVGYVYKLDEAGENRVVYEVVETTGPMKQDGTRADRGGEVEFIDADKKYAWNSRDPIANILRDIRFYDDDFGIDWYASSGNPKAKVKTYWPQGEEASYADIIRRVKEDVAYGGRLRDGVPLDNPRGDTLEIIERLNEYLAEISGHRYGGITYKGQVDSAKGIKDHNVRVYWYPEDQITLKKVDVDGRVSDEMSNYEAIARENANASGDAWIDEANASTKDLQDAGKKPSPFRNPDKFDANEKATVPLDGNLSTQAKKAIRELVLTTREGKASVDSGTTQLFLESQIRRMAGGSTELAQYIREVADEVAEQLSKNPLNTMDFKDVQNSVLVQVAELYRAIEDGGENYAQNLRKVFDKDAGDLTNAIFWIHDGEIVQTGNAATKISLEIIIKSLAKRVQMLAQGAMELPPGTTLVRQTDQIFDTMKVAMTEAKKISYMTGSELVQQNFDRATMSPIVKKTINRDLEVIAKRQSEYYDELARLSKEGTAQQRADLMELYMLSGGKVRVLNDIQEYLSGIMKGGRMDGIDIKGRARLELRSAYYNSMLSSLKTPLKAVIGTNFIGSLRSVQAFLGAQLPGVKNQRVAIQAMSQLNALAEGYSEGLRMFKHNWDLGFNKKEVMIGGKKTKLPQDQSYATRFSFSKDIKAWKQHEQFVERYGTDVQKASYAFLNGFVDFNTSPWVQYSQVLMGAGDSMARTIIGRLDQRLEATNAVLKLVDEGKLDINDVEGVIKSIEGEFRNAIFRKDRHGVDVVSDLAAKMAGDEAALTKRLTGSLAFLENIGQGTGMRAFFPFVRTGINALELSFSHTELGRLQQKWKDLVKGEPDVLLKQYGIKPENIEYERAILRGRRAMGNSLITLAFIASITGNMTGDNPPDQETRDLWKLNGIQPNSFKVGNTYISYRDIEPFNTILSATANLAAYQHILGEDLRDDWFAKLTWMGTSVLVDKSMLAGVADIGEVLNPTQGTTKNIERILAKFLVPQVLPYSGLLSQMNNILDANDKEASGLWEYIGRRLPIAKSAMAPKYDILSKDRSGKKFYPPPGNPLMTWFNALSPVAITWSEGDPVREGLREMSFDIPNILSTYKGVRLNSFEKSEIQRYMSMGSLRSRLNALMTPNGRWRKELDRYKELNLRNKDDKIFEQRFYQDVHRIFIQEKKIAMQKLLRENPKLAAKITERLNRKSYGKSGRYDYIEQLMNMPK